MSEIKYNTANSAIGAWMTERARDAADAVEGARLLRQYAHEVAKITAEVATQELNRAFRETLER